MSPLSRGVPPRIPVLESREKELWLKAIPQLFDDRSSPDFRETYGVLARRSRGLDVALTHIRLATLDLSEAELGSVHRVRLLLTEVSAAALDAEAHAVLHQPKVAENLRRLAALAHLGRIEVRSAPLGGWAPDFSVFSGHDGSFAVLVAHIVSTGERSTGGRSWPLSTERLPQRERPSGSVKSGNGPRHQPGHRRHSHASRPPCSRPRGGIRAHGVNR